MTRSIYTLTRTYDIMTTWAVGAAVALGMGLGVAFAASMGPIGYLFGLLASFGIVLIRRWVRPRA